jgi:MYXO-CTERM domain-containing protein
MKPQSLVKSRRWALPLFLSMVSSSHAATLAGSDFTLFTDAALVGQGGWLQYNTQTSAPLAVSSGRVTWSGGVTVNNQDAFLPFPAQVTQPVSDTIVLNFDVLLSVNAASTSNPSYFAALNTLTTSSTSGNFQNARLAALASGSGFVFGARVNGQGGYPFSFGTNELTLGQDYALRAEIHMVSGNANDFINLYVGPDFDNLSFHATASYGVGTVTDPLYGAIMLSQFGSATVSQPGVSIASISVTQVPEPTAAMLGLLGLLGATVRRRRQVSHL